MLAVARAYPGKFSVHAISSNERTDLLAEQAEEFKPAFAVIGDEKRYAALKKKVKGPTEVLTGSSGLEELAASDEADIVFIAISGRAALLPLIAALRAGKTVALASKEPIVTAGGVIKKIAKESSARILPVDSEHSAVFQCLAGRKIQDVEKIYLTASGGSVFGKGKDECDSLSVEEILNHPKWDMGRKITVDSATMMNKGLEVIEAKWLFDIDPEKINVVIHPEAVVHSMVQFVDGTITAGLFYPDMRFPILRALAYPEVLASTLPRVDFFSLGKLTFLGADMGRFPALDLAFEAVRAGGTAPAVLAGSDEAAVRLFLDGKIKFSEIIKKVEKVYARHRSGAKDPSLEEVISAEKWAFEEVERSC